MPQYGCFLIFLQIYLATVLVSVGVTKLNETVALMNQFSEGDYEKIAKANTRLAPIATVVVPNVRDDGLLALIGVLLWGL